MLDSPTTNMFVGFMLIILLTMVGLFGYVGMSELDIIATEANSKSLRDYMDDQSVEYTYNGRMRMVVGSKTNTSFTPMPMGNGVTTMMPRSSTSSTGPFVSFFEIDDYVLGVAEFDDERVVYDVLLSDSVSFDRQKYPYFRKLPNETERGEIQEAILDYIDFGGRDLFNFNMTNHVER